jgi:hypothetical protein
MKLTRRWRAGRPGRPARRMKIDAFAAFLDAAAGSASPDPWESDILALRRRLSGRRIRLRSFLLLAILSYFCNSLETILRRRQV